jgi:uncharacterized protein (UPF0297 family)
MDKPLTEQQINILKKIVLYKLWSLPTKGDPADIERAYLAKNDLCHTDWYEVVDCLWFYDKTSRAVDILKISSVRKGIGQAISIIEELVKKYAISIEYGD